MREKLIEILRVPIFPHELVDPLEAVADYLLDNDVVPVVRCKDCKHRNRYYCFHPEQKYLAVDIDYYCARGERRES